MALSAEEVTGVNVVGMNWIFFNESISCCWNVDLVIAVVVQGWSDIPTRGAMAGESAFALKFGFVDYSLSTKRSNVGRLKIEETNEITCEN